MSNYYSPTGVLIIGTREILTGVAIIKSISDDGEPEYEGSTEVDWDSQRSDTDASGGRLFVDEKGGIWSFSSLKKEGAHE